MKPLGILGILLISTSIILGCGTTSPIVTQTPEVTESVNTEIHINTASEVYPLYTITETVYLRDAPDGTVVGSLEVGARIHADCTDGWCRVVYGEQKGQYFWIGCTDRANGKGCEKR